MEGIPSFSMASMEFHCMDMSKALQGFAMTTMLAMATVSSFISFK
jgi:hypothetical protein